MSDSTRVVIDTNDLRELARYLKGALAELSEIRLEVVRAKAALADEPEVGPILSAVIARLEAIASAVSADHDGLVAEVLTLEAEEGAPVPGAAWNLVGPAGSAGGEEGKDESTAHGAASALQWPSFLLSLAGSWTVPPKPWDTAWVTPDGTVSITGGGPGAGFGEKYDEREWATVFFGGAGAAGAGAAAGGSTAGSSGVHLTNVSLQSSLQKLPQGMQQISNLSKLNSDLKTSITGGLAGAVGGEPAAAGGGPVARLSDASTGETVGAGQGTSPAGQSMAGSDRSSAGAGASPGSSAGAGTAGDASGGPTRTTSSGGWDLPDDPAEFAKEVAQVAEDFADDPIATAKEIADKAKEAAEKLADDPRGTVKDLVDQVKDAAEHFADDPIGSAEELGASLRELAKDSLHDVGSGVVGGIGDLIDGLGALSDPAAAVSAGAEFLAHTPVVEGIGKFMDNPGGALARVYADTPIGDVGDGIGVFMEDPLGSALDGVDRIGMVTGIDETGGGPGFDPMGEIMDGVDQLGDLGSDLGDIASDPQSAAFGGLERLSPMDEIGQDPSVIGDTAEEAWSGSVGAMGDGAAEHFTSHSENPGTGGVDLSPALNPQPEVPSAGVDLSPMLNPQPEVPSADGGAAAEGPRDE